MLATTTLFTLVIIAVLLPITAAFFYFIGELQKTRPILPYEPRRPVPWSGVDVLMFLVIMFLFEITCLKIGVHVSGIELPSDSTSLDSRQQSLGWRRSLPHRC